MGEGALHLQRGRFAIGTFQVGAADFRRVGVEGLEAFAKTPVETQLSEGGGAESGALAPKALDLDPDLSRIIEAWPALPDHIRAAVRALVSSATCA